ncbi:MAG: hypothetical protein KGZ50_07950 [Peptococcaceae bacterium]|nr:hypothetical protein [Peptococcaceae bacterium]
MSKLLFTEHPIVVSKELANLLGLNEAIVLQQIHYWLESNRKTGKHLHEGRHWTYNSIKTWHEENFEFWSFETVKRTFAKLESIGLLLTGSFNKSPMDKTKWYSIDEKELEKLQKSSVPKRDKDEKPVELAAPTTPNDPMDWVKMTQAIPETSTETSTETSPKQRSARAWDTASGELVWSDAGGNEARTVRFAECVSMTNAEHEKLLSTYGEAHTALMIRKLDNYKGSTNKKYKSDYRAILSWVADEVLKNHQKDEVRRPRSSLALLEELYEEAAASEKNGGP